MTRALDLLGSDPRPSFFSVTNASDLGLTPPEARGGIAVRTWVRSLAGMQKEALVVSDTGLAWRLVSDEGPYLAGHDRAPCPLCHFVTGMVASYASQIMSLARSRDVGLGNIELTLDNFYTMEGSALQGTMTGGASTPRLSVETSADIPSSEILALVEDAVVASPVHGLLADSLVSRFTTSSQRECSAGGEGRADGDSAATRSW